MENTTAKESLKRSASAMTAADDITPAMKRSLDRWNEAMAPAKFAETMKRVDMITEKLRSERNDPKRECKSITNDLNAGTHTLILEHNSANNAKCRAEKCLVEALGDYGGEKIHASYRINLQEVNPSNEHWSARLQPARRFFHVSCIESIGVDLSSLLKLQTSMPDRAYGVVLHMYQTSFHPAIEDWLKNKGKAYDVTLYQDDNYKAARKAYMDVVQPPIVLSGDGAYPFNIIPQKPVAPPKVPSVLDFVSDEEEAKECRLSEVLLSLMGGDHLRARVFKDKTRLQVLEVWGRVPDHLSEATILAKIEAIEKEIEIKNAQKAVTDDVQNEERSAADQPAAADVERTPDTTTTGNADDGDKDQAGQDLQVDKADWSAGDA